MGFIWDLLNPWTALFLVSVLFSHHPPTDFWECLPNELLKFKCLPWISLARACFLDLHFL
jgi:hypothetical protein